MGDPGRVQGRSSSHDPAMSGPRLVALEHRGRRSDPPVPGLVPEISCRQQAGRRCRFSPLSILIRKDGVWYEPSRFLFFRRTFRSHSSAEGAIRECPETFEAPVFAPAAFGQYQVHPKSRTPCGTVTFSIGCCSGDIRVHLGFRKNGLLCLLSPNPGPYRAMRS